MDFGKEKGIYVFTTAPWAETASRPSTTVKRGTLSEHTA
jgi:hypothetical protein